MALEDLIARLEQDADARVQAIRRKADDEVRALEAAEARAADEEAQGRLVGRRAALQAELRRELARARQQARAEELEARRALLGRVLARARLLVDEVAASDTYRAAVVAHCAEALSYLEGLEPVVRCPPSLVPVVAPVVAARPGAKLQPDEAMGPGVIAEARDGSVVVDSTLLARLERLEARLAVELLNAPEGAGAPS